MIVEIANDVHIVVLDSRIDPVSSLDLHNVLIELIEKGARKIICDLSKTEYIASAGLMTFLMAAKKLKQCDGEISLCSINQHVQKVFDISGFSKIFSIYESREKGLSSCQK